MTYRKWLVFGVLLFCIAYSAFLHTKLENTGKELETKIGALEEKLHQHFRSHIHATVPQRPVVHFLYESLVAVFSSV